MVDGSARGIIARDLITVDWSVIQDMQLFLPPVVMEMYFILSTNAMGSNTTAIWKAYKKGAYFGNPCFTQIHPTCIPVSGEYQS